ncbi:MAG: RNA polymerase sigma factor [Chitinophagaceae bacterium]|nr:MAG: RNA polymerase sigma factor [Chitinophagaceae bacterium]
MELTAKIPTADVLVEQCINGDKTAYRLLYERYARAMYNTALRITNNTADAEDVLQESFTDAFMQISSFRQQSTFGAWIKQIVVFKSISLIKKRRLSLVEMEPENLEVPLEMSTSEEEIEFNVNAVKAALHSLPDGYRAVLSLYLLEGYDQEEIANIMQVAPSTVRTQYIRGKQKLLAMLKKEKMYE